MMATFQEEETKDLTTCSVCFETFNGGRFKPKFLPCGHTFCLKCTKVNNSQTSVECGITQIFYCIVKLSFFHSFQAMADRPPPGQLNCPVCSKSCTVPGENADSFPNNLYSLHIIQLDKTNNELKKKIREVIKTNAKLTNILEEGQ